MKKSTSFEDVLKQANLDMRQAIADLATLAANMQITVNAIIKLASDVGSIYSIIYAADYNSSIFQNIDIIRKLIDRTAYQAEVLSQITMQVSAQVSQITLPALQPDALKAYTDIKKVNDNIKRLALRVKTVDVNLDNATRQVSVLSTKIIRMKAVNPLISDELIERITTAVKDADNAIALTLVAYNTFNRSKASIIKATATVKKLL